MTIRVTHWDLDLLPHFTDLLISWDLLYAGGDICGWHRKIDKMGLFALGVERLLCDESQVEVD